MRQNCDPRALFGDEPCGACKQIKSASVRKQEQQQHATYDRHTMSKDEEMINTLTELMKQIKSLLWNDPEILIDISCGNNCHKQTLKNAIAKIRGNDPRTPKKWENKLLEFAVISKAAKNYYKILNDGHQSLDTKTSARSGQTERI